MWRRYLLPVVLLAGACTLAEPVDDLTSDSWSELADPDVDLLAGPDDVRLDAHVVSDCQKRYAQCMDSKLGDVYDDYDHTRCWYCRSRCNDEGCWPDRAYAGKDCDYTKDKYKRKPQEKVP